MQQRDGELEVLELTSKDLRDSDAVGAGLVERIQSTCAQWDAIKSTVKQRIHVANDFLAVQQSADKVLTHAFFAVHAYVSVAVFPDCRKLSASK